MRQLQLVARAYGAAQINLTCKQLQRDARTVLVFAVCSLVKVINLIIARPDPEFCLAWTHRDTWKDRNIPRIT